MAPDTCPNCGADVPRDARACPECGACDETGWSEDAQYGHADIPDDSFDYREFVKREFGAKRLLPHGMGWFWWSVSLGVIGVLIWLVIR